MDERVQKIISNAGHCSRRYAEELIAAGKVFVNGKRIKLGDKADVDKDKIVVDNIEIERKNYVYIMLNKPKHYEVTMAPDKKSVLQLIPVAERIFPVGRLDKNTTGLLLFTNDGDFANKITHPRYEKEKTYSVILDKRISDNDIRKIEEGMYMKDGRIYGKIKKYGPKNLELTIHEGKKWIIKRIFFKLGYYVEELSRTKIGNLKLNLKPSKWRYLRPKEVEDLMR
jgi:23S rRNA pseudouridine2605 synthase